MKINEITKAKIDTIKPGVEATVDNGDGTKTVVDLKKNPTLKFYFKQSCETLPDAPDFIMEETGIGKTSTCS